MMVSVWVVMWERGKETVKVLLLAMQREKEFLVWALWLVNALVLVLVALWVHGKVRVREPLFFLLEPLWALSRVVWSVQSSVSVLALRSATYSVLQLALHRDRRLD